MTSRSLAIATLLILSPVETRAQTGSLAGQVLHPNGSPVRDAPIRVRNGPLGVDARTQSSDEGRYFVGNLPPGSYTVSVFMPCCEFAPYLNDAVTIGGAEAANFDIHLIMVELGVEGDNPATISAEIRDRQSLPDAPAPRTADGWPDLSGVWLIVDDPFPEPPHPLPWAQELSEARIANSLRDHPHTRCLPGSPPIENSTPPFMGKFVQTPELIVILSEGTPGFRQIFLDGRAHPDNLDPNWMGHSIGRWEGDTLVVDTVGFNNRGWTATFPRTEMFRMEERYTRVDYGHLDVRVTFDDPGVFEEPWIRSMTWVYAPEIELLEYVCENNKWAREE